MVLGEGKSRGLNFQWFQVLNCLAAEMYCSLHTAVYACAWLCMVVAVCMWLHMVAYGCVWVYMAVYGRTLLYIAVHGCI